MATEVRRFNTFINNTPCCVVVLNDGALDVRAANGLPSEALAAAYHSASADERYRLQAEADAARMARIINVHPLLRAFLED